MLNGSIENGLKPAEVLFQHSFWIKCFNVFVVEMTNQWKLDFISGNRECREGREQIGISPSLSA